MLIFACDARGQKQRRRRAEMGGDRLDAAGVLRSSRREGPNVGIRLEPVPSRRKSSADSIDVGLGRSGASWLKADQPGDIADQTQSLVAQQDGGGPALRIADQKFEDQGEVHEGAERTRPAGARAD